MSLIIKHLGIQPYPQTWQAMRQFTQQRDADTPDEIWLLQHFPVFTQGQAGKPEHILNPKDIPIVHSDRGGQVTYHGPGQLVAYVLLNLRRYQLSIRALVTCLENSVIHLLADYGITAKARCDAPGVYVNQAKICSVGLRISNGCSYHGLALNVDMDLRPFESINPCGFSHLSMTQLKTLCPSIQFDEVEQALAQHLADTQWKS